MQKHFILNIDQFRRTGISMEFDFRLGVSAGAVWSRQLTFVPPENRLVLKVAVKMATEARTPPVVSTHVQTQGKGLFMAESARS